MIAFEWMRCEAKRIDRLGESVSQSAARPNFSGACAIRSNSADDRSCTHSDHVASHLVDKLESAEEEHELELSLMVGAASGSRSNLFSFTRQGAPFT